MPSHPMSRTISRPVILQATVLDLLLTYYCTDGVAELLNFILFCLIVF
jgi:hypothetical protein